MPEKQPFDPRLMGSQNTELNAVFSEDRKYRYFLLRVWDRRKPKCVFIGLNPSTANEVQNDPTVTRCRNYARFWGYGGLHMLNIFGFRATDPKVMKTQEDPNGDENDHWLVKISKNAGIVICAWGTHGAYRERGKEVISMLDNAGVALHCLGETKDGFPKHPLYLRADAKPQPFIARDHL